MSDRLNFTGITALIVDSDRYSAGIISQILRGFGLSQQVFVGDGADAKKSLGRRHYDLLITECVLPDVKGAELIRWVRRSSSDKLRLIPIILLTGYTHYSNVTGARDSGVSSVVRKPVSPAVLFDHIAWAAKSDRPFIEADEYSGPDRRFRFGEAAPGLDRRLGDHIPDPGMLRQPEAQANNKEEATS